MLQEKGIDNGITISDLHNIQQRFCKNDFADIPEFIATLERTGHEVRYRVDEEQKITSIFFIHKNGLEELKRLPESIIVDATYKTNSHRMVLLNFVVAGTLVSEYNPRQLATIPVAGCWMKKETAEYYEWALVTLRSVAWPQGTSASLLPNNFVTDKDAALMGAVKKVFPDAHHILCYIHISANFLKKFNTNLTQQMKLSKILTRSQ